MWAIFLSVRNRAFAFAQRGIFGGVMQTIFIFMLSNLESFVTELGNVGGQFTEGRITGRDEGRKQGG